jgi:ABC-2 type transport system ATP-binding protein
MQADEVVGLSRDDLAPTVTPVISARGLRKVYGSRVAVAGLDLDVPAGVVFGLLGPNGAGKTTVIKMMLGLAIPSAGTVTLFGRLNADPRARARVGFLPEHFRFHEWLSAREFLDFHGRLYGIASAERGDRVERALHRVGLAHRATSQLGTFSKGMLPRIGLAQALLNDPLLLVLDEPTSGLDPVGRREIRDLILELREEGVTVLLNSHILSEVERVCDEVAILDLGKLAWQGRPDGLGEGRLAVVVQIAGAPPGLLDTLRATVPDITAEDGLLSFSAPDAEVVAEVAAAIVASGARLYRLEPKQPSLEDLFVRLVQGRDV